MSIQHSKASIEQEFQRAYALHRSNRIADAKLIYEQILTKDPKHLNSLHLLGLMHLDTGELDTAERYLSKASSRGPANEGLLFSLGNLNRAKGNAEQAIALFQQALQIKPDYPEALHNITVLQLEQGRPAAAMESVLRNLTLKESPDCKAIFCHCLQAIDLQQLPEEGLATIENYALRALSESWTRPAGLIPACLALLSRDSSMAKFLQECVQSWPDLVSSQNTEHILIAISENKLLLKLLETTIIPSVNFEKALTNLRFLLLKRTPSSADPESLTALTSALSRQCFINEYIFSISRFEKSRSEELRAELTNALAADEALSTLSLLLYAMYSPLNVLANADRLLERKIAEEAQPVVKQQLEEPLLERQYRREIPTLTAIENTVSKAVRDQYEQNPYPRWVETACLSKVDNVFVFLRRMFQWAPIEQAALANPPAILIAGCGTGQQPIGTAQRFPAAKVVAIDLSASSLSYAQRKSVEAGIENIEFAQADILHLDQQSMGSFDVIESTGVLHHMSDPLAGWGRLTDLLKPGGFMNIGLYSELGRQDVVAAKQHLSALGFKNDADGIRQSRQELFKGNGNRNSRDIFSRRDFYSVSSCRDLLFHACEHRFDLKTIGDFLKSNRLRFISFKLDSRVLQGYRSRFPDDPQMTNLSNWDTFETENPTAFRGMYQFWVQKEL